MDDVYKPPESDLTRTVSSTTQYGSLEKGINGDYELSIRDTIKEAWELTSGVKGKIIGAILLAYLTALIAAIGITFILSMTGLANNILGNIALQIISTAIAYPLWVGISIIGIRRAVRQEVAFTAIYSYFGSTIPLFFAGILVTVLVMVGFLLFILPGIYLAFAYILTLPLLVEKGLTPWQALETSRKTISNKWFKFFGLLLVLGLIVTVSAIPLGIGLIWTVPLSVIALGIAYRNMFGVEPI